MTQSDSSGLHEPAKKRIAEGTISGENVVELLEDMAREAGEAGLEGHHVAVCYIEESDEFVPGTYVPEIHLVLRLIDE